MDVLLEVLPIILYILGAVLIVMLIIFVSNLIDTVKKANILLDDIENKVQSLNGMFSAIDSVSGTISSVNSKIVNAVTNIVQSVFKKKKKKYNYVEEEDIYE